VTLSQPSMDKVICGPNVSSGIPSPPPPEEPFLEEYAHEKQYQVGTKQPLVVERIQTQKTDEQSSEVEDVDKTAKVTTSETTSDEKKSLKNKMKDKAKKLKKFISEKIESERIEFREIQQALLDAELELIKAQADGSDTSKIQERVNSLTVECAHQVNIGEYSDTSGIQESVNSLTVECAHQDVIPTYDMVHFLDMPEETIYEDMFLDFSLF